SSPLSLLGRRCTGRLVLGPRVLAPGGGRRGRRRGGFLLALASDVLARRDQDRAGALGADAVDLPDRLLVGRGELLRRLEAVLVEQLRRDVADVRDRGEGGPGPAGLVLRLGLAPHVELPAGQPRGEADVLALLTDSERELIVGDNDFHRALVLVHDDLRDL